MKLGFFRQIIEKSSNMKFYENPLSGSRRTDRQIHMTKLVKKGKGNTVTGPGGPIE
jgi:hypothetical protein